MSFNLIAVREPLLHTTPDPPVSFSMRELDKPSFQCVLYVLTTGGRIQTQRNA